MISEHTPVDLDECANQEPPIQLAGWAHSRVRDKGAPATSKPLLSRDFSNSCSSGYSSASQSAPPTCNAERVLNFAFGWAPSTNPVFSNQSQLTLGRKPDGFGSSPPTLRRTQSCYSRGWLSKRHRAQNWPRISGIMKSFSGSMSPHIADTNSCPAALTSGIQSGVQYPEPPKRLSLPPLGERFSPVPDTSPSHAPTGFDKFNFSRTSAEGDGHLDVSLDCSGLPQAKKLRMDNEASAFPIAPADSSREDKVDVDNTLPLDDSRCDAMHNSSEHVKSGAGKAKVPFEVFRHHSTPLVSARPLHLPFVCQLVSSPTPQIPLANKPLLSRSSSVPVSTISEKLGRCISILDNPNFRCDGRRPRALPVISRTDSGLHCVSIDTVAELVTNPDDKRNPSFVIIDCRFPYEYDGGHINGAINIFTHSDLVLEIFNRVPAQRPPGSSGPPKILGECLAKRLALAPREPLSAPCEPISDEESDEDDLDLGQFTSEASQLELAVAAANENNKSDPPEDGTADSRLETDISSLSSGTNFSGSCGSQESAFVVIFHCEFSSQRAPDLAAFLRSVDRLSNYHRYPFLYFPEIYVMKGGYSAFFQKYSHICTPQTYVKMSNRDYRTHFRLYRRLTKRVSSACTACIRPQHKLLDQPVVDPMNSFGQTSLTNRSMEIAKQPLGSIFPTLDVRPQPAGIVACEDEAMLVPMDACEDQENINNTSGAPLNSPSNRPVESPVSRRCSPHAMSDVEDTASSLSDSPLSLAETVIRVGRRVIAATLCTADPSIGANNLLEKFNSQIAKDATRAGECARPREPLKRASTVVGMGDWTAEKTANRSKRTPTQQLITNPFLCDESKLLQTTPAFDRTRPVTVIRTPLNCVNNRQGGLVNFFNTSQTPIIPGRTRKPSASSSQS
ncbi:rhodanese-like protein [Opisthorchis viverrini]|uniref:Rhodanese-like protein n=2 Tax=Opisthorchis viverrini TaxID=6198 RepID=A0A1S8WVG6_OPIVI|nr:rhodanese-like protein [Opisthorchis viverrini]